MGDILHREDRFRPLRRPDLMDAINADMTALAEASADFDRKADALLADMRAERARLANLNTKGGAV